MFIVRKLLAWLKDITPWRRKNPIVTVEWLELEFSFRTDWFLEPGEDYLLWAPRERSPRFRHIRDHPVDHQTHG